MPLIELGISRDIQDQRGQGVASGKRTMNPQNSPALLGGSAGGFQSARIDRLTKDWSTTRRSPDQELFNGLVRLRARARERALNSPVAAKFLQMMRTNIVGAHGVKLEFKIEKQRVHDAAEVYDEPTNDKLRTAWRKWCKRKYCTMQGNLSFQDVLNMWCDSIGRDGEFLLRRVYVDKKVNPFGFALQLIDADQLNESINIAGSPKVNQVRMGVEVDKYQRPVNYYIYDGNPVEFGFGSSNCKVVPAEQIYHSYIPRRIGQSRGYPLLAPVLWDINMLDRYFDAELTAARTGASLMATIETTTADGEFEGDGELSDGSAKIELANGTIPILGPGQKLNNQTPQHPTAAFNPFVERSLRLISSGLGVPYHELGNDLAGVNFSSGRLGVQESRDYWMELQRMMIESIVQPVYEDWLKSSLLCGAIDLPYDPERYSDDESVHYMPRRWDWVDPLKDTQATILQISEGLETREGALRKKGTDWRKVMEQTAIERDYALALGIDVGTDIRGQDTSEVDDGPPGDSGPVNASGNEDVKPDDSTPAKPAAKPSVKPPGKKAPKKPKGKAMMALTDKHLAQMLLMASAD